MPELHPNSARDLLVAMSRPRDSSLHFRHVMACLDHSPQSRRVLAEAAAIAEVMGAELTVLRVMDAGTEAMRRPVDPVDWDLGRREEEAELGRLVGEICSVPDIHTEVMSGASADCICRKAHAAGVDLIVLGVGGRDRWTEWGLGSTVRQVAERAAGSVLIVPESPANDVSRQAPGGRVLVPLDSSTWAEAVLPIALRAAESRSAELVLLHAVPDISLTGNSPPDAHDEALRADLRHRNERVAQAYLDRIRALLPADALRTRVRLISGEDPRRALARAVNEEAASLVVLSARGQGAHPDLPIGSTAEYLISAATVPVLLVRRPEAGSRPSAQAAPWRLPMVRAPV
ncbi:universal stress protein [Thioclava nitratireducens]|uniref:universal stress protein n=1 Tax=Thioclava nitratireducens TaxID=1915078 RepID=UPI0024817B88|nr:universal stress protein [Thioclava nitratireducens]WGT51330.1 universal stress protein [Thioclava nitratireducens]